MGMHLRHLDISDRTRACEGEARPTKAAPTRGAPSAAARADATEGSSCHLLCIDPHAAPQGGLHSFFLAASLRMLGSEPRASVQLQPLRLVLHQSTLAFLLRFFAVVAGADDASQPPPATVRALHRPPSPPQPPRTPALTSQRPLRPSASPPSPPSPPLPDDEEWTVPAAGAFFHRVEVHQLDVRFDYVPSESSAAYRRALQSTASGDVPTAAAELASRVPLRDVTFCLARVRVRHAPSWAAVLDEVASEWLPQLLRQLHRFLSGLPVVRSLVHISDGLATLLLAPIRPAPLRGLQHGGVALGRAVAIEGLSLTANALEYAQSLFEQIHAAISAVPVGALVR